MNSNNRNKSIYISPKTWRIAVNVFLIIISVSFLFTSIIYFAAGAQIGGSSANNASFLSAIMFLVATLMLVDGVALLILGIVLCTKTYSGVEHKRLLLISLMVLLADIFFTNILTLIAWTSVITIVFSIINLGLSLSSFIFFLLSYKNLNVMPNKEKQYAFIGSILFAVIEGLSGIINLISAFSSDGTQVFISVFSMLFALGFAVVIIFYFYNLNKQGPKSIVISGENSIKNKKDLINYQALQIKAFKKLLDSGAITQEEYDKKKEEILNHEE